ncbi:phosphatidate cytidylyltransferase [Protaetiibacter intestinalis]|uniref:Phosphatidate cytidylyltransferase n=1 Tax=Protaetiibacter intestinalis TaxID=2419774 RepID=A0A387B4W1_9MICO|nr:phosphatidate cytidylyltransferase [Protaetiibacter intestinalis]AYF98622.1 phosphatidate cytidylyltransferase [Protaetiibacter intestinalis]
MDDDRDSEPAGAAPRRRSSREEFEARAHQTRLDIEAQALHAKDEFEAQVKLAREQFDATQEKINARTGRNLLAAIGIGVVLGGALLVSLLFYTELFMLFAGVLIGFTVFELSTALRGQGRDVPRVASVVVALAVVPVAFYWHVPGLWFAIIGAVLVITLWRIGELVRPSHRGPARVVFFDIGAGLFVQLYITFLAGFYVVLAGEKENGGQWWLLAALIIVVTTDVGAYAAGLTFGKHKMAPKISPGKTWEGFAGAAIAAMTAGSLLAWLMLGQPWWEGTIMGLTLMLVGTMGDLIESLIKRELGIKDISGWLPGHGGFLDRLDSILPSAAVAYAFFLIFH